MWYTGRNQGKTVGTTLGGHRTVYDRGVFFNSAKFFNIEYQTYGEVPTRLAEDEDTLYWEHPGGKKSIRITYRQDGTLIGFVLMGVRYRHEVCEAWIREGASVRQVVENLGAANFDPEFFKQYEEAIVTSYNDKHPHDPITLKRKRGNLAGLFQRINA